MTTIPHALRTTKTIPTAVESFVSPGDEGADVLVKLNVASPVAQVLLVSSAQDLEFLLGRLMRRLIQCGGFSIVMETVKEQNAGESFQRN